MKTDPKSWQVCDAASLAEVPTGLPGGVSGWRV
jgi:hypothetical protein